MAEHVRLIESARAFVRVLRDFDPSLLSGDDCALAVTELATVGKACNAARARAAARAADCGAHRGRGFGDAADWLGNETGTSPSASRKEIDTARALENCPATAKAAAAGDVSMEQAAEIARTEAECPGSEAELLDLAKKAPLPKLANEARRRRQAAADPDDLHRRQRKARYLRWWQDELGMIHLRGALCPEDGLPLVQRLEAETRRLAKGSNEAWEALTADALVSITNGGGRRGGTDLVLVCDINAWRRGHAHEGEPCRVVGGSPLPVEVLKDLAADDSFLKVVLHDGRTIHLVKHFGRHVPAEVRTALDLGSPPDFDGRECGCGCGGRRGLQTDHIDPLDNGGATEFKNLQPLTGPHHRRKTEEDRRAGKIGSGGGRRGPPP